MARGAIVKMSYWTFGLIRPDGDLTDVKDLKFNWHDVTAMTTDEQLRVGKIVEFDVGRDRWDGKLKVTRVWPYLPDKTGASV
jgi:cold shock CspA family protein